MCLPGAWWGHGARGVSGPNLCSQEAPQCVSEETPPLPTPPPGSKRHNSKAINQTQVPIRTHKGRGTLKGPKSPACTDPSQNHQVRGGRRQSVRDGNKTLQLRKNHYHKPVLPAGGKPATGETLCSHTERSRWRAFPKLIYESIYSTQFLLFFFYREANKLLLKCGVWVPGWLGRRARDS